LSEVVLGAARLGAANDAVDAAAAAVLGVNRTDLRIIGLVQETGALAAGPLAAAAHLSPAATSTAIQRLVAAGYLTREVDPADRRRAVVRLTPEASAQLDRLYGPIEQAGRRELARYTVAELTVILDFLRRGERMQLGQAARIRELGPPTGAARVGA
ncbi:MAG TPA: MarR family transcriptional regulator, partial [Actinoplanes sp.]|nr:MarR family transcriptional regulator [Actinoplanes sp.]